LLEFNSANCEQERKGALKGGREVGNTQVWALRFLGREKGIRCTGSNRGAHKTRGKGKKEGGKSHKTGKENGMTFTKKKDKTKFPIRKSVGSEREQAT